MLDDQQWQMWAEKAQGGDKRAYADLLKDVRGYTYNVLSGTLANPDWAEDIAQEVLVSVHKALPSYSPDRPFKPWLLSIVKFRRTDFLRKHYRHRQHEKTSLDDPSFVRTHVTNPVFAGEYQDVERALDGLPEHHRRSFMMMKIHGHSARDVADKLGMSVSAVKVSVHRTMKKLKDILA